METTFDISAYEARVAASAALEAEVLPRNKQVLFALLANSGIARVVVTFDGVGDSGQIENVEAFDAESNAVDLPTQRADYEEIVFATLAIDVVQRTARKIVEIMAYDFLESTHPGWEDGEGAYGEFTFTVAAGTITLEYNERYIESTFYEHEF